MVAHYKVNFKNAYDQSHSASRVMIQLFINGIILDISGKLQVTLQNFQVLN